MLKIAVLNGEIMGNFFIFYIFSYIFYNKKDITFVILKTNFKPV